MNVTYRNGKDRNAGKKYQGCLGKMVNLFELNIGLPANKRITDKPHQDGFTSSRRISSDLSSTTTYGDRAEVKETKSDRKSHIKPVKMLMDQEMSKELRYKQSPPNLVAKLMGLDSLPPQENPIRAAHRAHTRSRSVIPLSDYEQDNGFHERVDDDEKMALVRQKFAEAKLLSMDERHRNSKKLQDALDVLNSNKDLFLKCLQEPSPLFRNNYDDPHLPTVEKKRITILRPSKLAEDEQNGRQKNDDISFQPTRIVVLKPKSQIDEDYAVDAEDEDDDDEGREAREVAKAITIQVREKLGRYHAMDSSLFSKGYAGDDSSFNRSEFEYSEAMSPVSRHSWDCVNRAASPYSPSALSRASYSSESSVSKEAKKRLSERWALMSTATTNENPREIRTFHRSSSTLGEMLSLSEVKKAAAVSAEGEIVREEENGKDSNNVLGSGQRLVDESETPRNLIRSKSLPASSATKEEAKTANSTSKSSLRVKVSNLLFSRNRKAGKDKSHGSTIEDGIQPISGEITPVNASPSSQECPSAVVSLSDHIGKKDITCSEDKPSPLSVLDAAPFEEDLPRCEPINKLGSKAIDKSPPIGSIARTLSYDDVRDPSTSIQESESDKQEYVAYVETLLFSGLKGPLDPSLRDKYVDQCGKEGLTEAKRRQKRSMQKLMFDYVSAELIEDDDDKGSSSSSNLLERVNEWFCRRNVSLSENFGDDYIMVVEGVVREEVIGGKWIDGLREEREVFGGEIEGKLIEELVLEMILG